MTANPLSGHFLGQKHILPLRVYYEDTDALGILYHASHVRFFERGRTEMLRLLGVEQTRLKADHDIGFVLRRLEIDYQRPGRLDDSLQVQTEVLEIDGARLTLRQTLKRFDEKDQGGVDLARAMVFLTSVNGPGRPTRLPVTVAELFREYKAR